MREILFYTTKSGECPVEEFIDTLESKQAQKVAWVMRLVEELGKVPSTYLKKLSNTQDIWEVRVQVGSNIFRFLGFFSNGNFIVLTNGFQKKTQKTPKAEIILSEKRKQEYLGRKTSE